MPRSYFPPTESAPALQRDPFHIQATHTHCVLSRIPSPVHYHNSQNRLSIFATARFSREGTGSPFFPSRQFRIQIIIGVSG